MKNNEKILKEIAQLKELAELIVNKAAMLEQELSNVVFGSSARKGGAYSKEKTSKALLNREKTRTKKR